jgi:hypothetical protein
MNESLRAVVLSQLDATQAAEAEWAVPVLAAVEGSGELAALLDGGRGPLRHGAILSAVEEGVLPPRVGWHCQDCPVPSRCWAWR